MSCNRARRMVRADHGSPEKGGTLLPPYGCEHAKKFSPKWKRNKNTRTQKKQSHRTDRFMTHWWSPTCIFWFTGWTISPMSFGSQETRSTSRHKDIREKHYNKANSPLWLCSTLILFIRSSRSLKTEWTHTLSHTNFSQK